MASIRRSFIVAVEPDTAWAAIRDVGAVHLRLAWGFVTATELDDDTRMVTFANGMIVTTRRKNRTPMRAPPPTRTASRISRIRRAASAVMAMIS